MTGLREAANAVAEGILVAPSWPHRPQRLTGVVVACLGALQG
jgi:hypothetical protein